MEPRTVYRPLLTRVLAACYAAVALWWLGAVLVGPRPAEALVLGLVLLAVGVVVYVLLWRPAVVVDEHGVRLLNLVRDVDVPWPALEGVETRYALTLLTAHASYQSWAGAAAGRPQRSVLLGAAGRGTDDSDHRLPDRRWQPDVPTPDRASRDLRADSGAAAFLVEQGWAGWRSRPAAAREETGRREASVRWNVPVVAALVSTIAAAVLALVLAA